jgi:penicillin-binding protein 1C
MRPQPVSPTFLSADGMPLRQLLCADGQRVARIVTYEELPPMLIHATLAAEDKRFFSHGGVDLIAVSRAVWDNVASRRVVSGASTLTQQLAKISADRSSERTWSAKIVEAMEARRLEMTWSKERILAEYLNRVNYGNLLTGCSSAAEGYFHKPLRDLTPAECALLAALPQSPTRLNPFRNMKGVEKLKKLILERMAELGWLDDEAKTLALAEKPVLQRYTGGFEAPHAVEMFRSADTPVRSGGPDPEGMAGPGIRLTLDSAAQRLVENAIEKHLASLEAKHVTQSAAVIIENKTGSVLALAGSRDYFSADGGQLNGAWVPHSPGSALKPFTYLLAFDRGYTPASVIADLPVEYATPTGLYRPENYDRKNYGPVTVRDALGNSLNIPAVKTLRKIGGEKILYDTLQSLGITTLTAPPEHYGLGLTIGNAPVRLLELANAYACLARLGEWKEWQITEHATADRADVADKILNHETDPRISARSAVNPPALSRQTCYLIADILSDPQARLISFGPRTVIRLPFRCAVKTGTSTNYRDNWTLGYTPEFTVGVWCGNFDNSPMANVSGISGAGPIFREIMMWLHEKRGTSWYAEPDGVAHATIDPRNGKRLDAASPPARTSRDEIFPSVALPPPATAQDYDGEGRAILPPEYASWIAQGDHWLTGLVVSRADKKVGLPPRILNPANGSVFVLDPDLPNRGERLLLRAVGGGAVKWSSRTLAVSTAGGLSYATLTPGTHELCVVDEVSGAEARARIEVRPAHSASQAR